MSLDFTSQQKLDSDEKPASSNQKARWLGKPYKEMFFMLGQIEGLQLDVQQSILLLNGDAFFDGQWLEDVEHDGINDLWIGKTNSNQISFIPGWNFQ